MAGAILCVPDEHLPIVLDPALTTQDVVNAGCHLVPLKVVPKPERDRAWEGSWLAGSGKQVPPSAGEHLSHWNRSHGSGSGCAMKGDL